MDPRPVLEGITTAMLNGMDRFGGAFLASELLGPIDQPGAQTQEKHVPADINCGQCYLWAGKAMDALGGASESCRMAFINNGDGITEYEFGHVALFFEGKYYDAECMDGVERAIDLPYFKDLNGREELLFIEYLPEIA